MPERKKQEQDIGGTVVVWDDAGMNTLYGTLFSARGTREEISLLFAGRSVHTGRGEETMKVSDRIILSPYTAKRLLVLLRKIMAQHELRFSSGRGMPRAIIETSN